MKKLASILIPSRGRFDELLEGIQSIIDTTDNLDDVEVMVALDEDDKSSLDRLDEIPTEVQVNVSICERHGYLNLHKYINELCEKSVGEFLFLFNDDCVIVTKGWDNIVRKFSGQVVCLNPNQDGLGKKSSLFPILSREAYDVIGYFSQCTANDTWQMVVSRQAGIEVHVDEFVIMHNRQQEFFSDDNRREILNKTQAAWRSLKHVRDADSKKIRDYLRKKKNGRD